MNKFLSCAFASAFAVSAFAAAVRTLPEPDADGYYVFGAPYTYSKTTAYEWKGDCNQPAFPVWSEIGLPNNAKVKFVGGVILDSFPANVAEIDCSELTFMAIIKSDIKNLAGQKLLIPEGAKLCLSNTKSSYPTWSGDAMTAWAETHALFKLHADIEVNGTLCWCKNTLEIHGALSGSGEFNMSHDTADTKLYGSTAFTGMVKAPAATSASGSVYMYPPDTKTSIGSVVYNCTSAKTAYFLHVPESTPCEIKIDDIGSQTAGAATYPIVGFSGNSAVQIKTLFGSGLRFATIGAATTVQSDDIGGATVEIDDVVVPKYKSTVLGGVYRLSKNMSYKIKEIGGDLTGAVNPRTVEFTYSDEMGDNTNSLSIGTVNWWKYQTVSVSAPTPAVAPRTVSLLDGHVNVRIAESDWSFGFDWTREDPNLSRCEITGAENATIPECGTIAITTVGKPGAKTVYPLFTCNVGCAALADAAAWPVTINGTLVEGDEFSDGTAKYKIIRTETGIYLQANTVKGLMLLFR